MPVRGCARRQAAAGKGGESPYAIRKRIPFYPALMQVRLNNFARFLCPKEGDVYKRQGLVGLACGIQRLEPFQELAGLMIVFGADRDFRRFLGFLGRLGSCLLYTSPPFFRPS